MPREVHVIEQTMIPVLYFCGRTMIKFSIVIGES